MYLLYPRLPLAIAEKIAASQLSMGVEHLWALSAKEHAAIEYAPTGGNRITSTSLGDLQKQVRECAKRYGYPGAIVEATYRQFDIECGILLFKQMYLHPSEASHLEMWAFITCVLLPDVVRWRFSGDSTSIERFIGSDRGLRRNTFGRLWWRTYLFNEPTWKDPFLLLKELVEDDLVQLTERNSIAASHKLLITFCGTFLFALKRHNTIPRRLLMREASKRIHRFLSLISFDALDGRLMVEIIDDIFRKTAQSLSEVVDEADRSLG